MPHSSGEARTESGSDQSQLTFSDLPSSRSRPPPPLHHDSSPPVRRNYKRRHHSWPKHFSFSPFQISFQIIYSSFTIIICKKSSYIFQREKWTKSSSKLTENSTFMFIRYVICDTSCIKSKMLQIFLSLSNHHSSYHNSPAELNVKKLSMKIFLKTFSRLEHFLAKYFQIFSGCQTNYLKNSEHYCDYWYQSSYRALPSSAIKIEIKFVFCISYSRPLLVRRLGW